MADDNGMLHLEDLQGPITREATIDDVTFYLYSPNGNLEMIPAANFASTIQFTNFDKTKKTIFITHGWNNDHSSSINTLIRSAVLKHHEMNVFVVDWSGPANSINYISAKAASIKVGGYVGDCLNFLIDSMSYSPSNIYMVGHSLGAHASGAAGARSGGRIYSIVGLDAAKPLFSFEEVNERLDPSDAQFVHVIHTNGALLGFSDPIGDVDFYPNGGNKQAGCGLDLVGTCSHGRSFQYYAESISSDNFQAVQCGSYDDYQLGRCNGNHVSVMGRLDVDRTLV